MYVPVGICNYVHVDSVDTSAATTDVITATSEPSAPDVVESSTHLRHVTLAATFPPAFARADTITTSAPRRTHHSQPNFTFISPSSVTSQHGGVKPEPETECGGDGRGEEEKAELVKCRTSRNESLHDVRT